MQLILALDFQNRQSAMDLVNCLDPKEVMVKIGFEMFSLFGPDLVKELVAKGFKVFLDLKFHDIPNTVARACRACGDLGVWMLSLHASGGPKMMEAARAAFLNQGPGTPLLMAVTILTSIDAQTRAQLGLVQPLDQDLKRLAILAKSAGLDGAIASPHEAPIIKDACGSEFLVATPGIRLEGDVAHDQLRVARPEDAKQWGVNYIIVGRSITAAADPLGVLRSILSCV